MAAPPPSPSAAVGAQSSFRDSPASTTALTNFPTTLSCTFQQPVPSGIRWERDDSQVLGEGGRLSISYDGITGRSELRVASVRYGDAGDYLCRALDAGGRVLASSETATIVVQGIKVVLTQGAVRCIIHVPPPLHALDLQMLMPHPLSHVFFW